MKENQNDFFKCWKEQTEENESSKLLASLPSNHKCNFDCKIFLWKI